MEFPEGLDVRWISRAGEDVDPAAHLVPGKVTVFDFYTDWCGPCRDVDRAMREVLQTRPDLALRKLNVVDWNSPLARARLANVASLPYVEVYGKNGRRVAAIAGLDTRALLEAIAKGAEP